MQFLVQVHLHATVCPPEARGPPNDIPSHETLQPTFEASVYMTLESVGYCKLFDAVIMLSFHHFKSRSPPSFDSVTLHSKLPFGFFDEHVLHLSNAPQQRGLNLFSGKLAAKVQIRLAGFLIPEDYFSRWSCMTSVFSFLLHSATCLLSQM